MRRDPRVLRKKSEEVANLLKQLAHPQRLLLLCCLLNEEQSVQQLEENCRASQSQISQFLKIMKYEGLVSSRREGKFVFYKISDDRLVKLMRDLDRIFCQE